ncbi:DUF4097 family beta strand repeat-containing protein [Hymenobacter perfusus]|uniref:DUF4097 domain-containing protein n=1 Tax=Hymenobacter perfusus TaxID=1236770 RepID=A0A428KAJ0_9BACT|nr:DUF4097 family beta strand repeat-containing protein [Hymenobacter perfusus]RSK43476.1 hypothetical protein EI293_11315 [Hymenobacter perfusus]
MKTPLLFLLLIGTLPVAAQKTPVRSAPPKTTAGPAFTITCADQQPASALQKLHCETRELTLPAPPVGTALMVDARVNGGLTVRGYAGNTVRVRARITGRAATPESAKALAAAVRITSENSLVRAGRANESLDGWAVDYEVFVPFRTDLVLKAVNGGITLENVEGKLRFDTTNGGLVLTGINGEARGQTTNGSVTIVLTGPAWVGPGLEVNTVNGSVSWQLPATYAATVLARTTHGKVSAALNTKRKSVLPHSLVATLGKGGAQLKANTVHGSITVTQPAEIVPVVATDSTDTE